MNNIKNNINTNSKGTLVSAPTFTIGTFWESTALTPSDQIFACNTHFVAQLVDVT